MKHTMIFIFILTFFSSCSNNERPTDLKEYGYFGDVKKIKSTRYGDLEKEDGIWILEEDKIHYKQEISFNKDGNMFEVKFLFPVDNTSWLEQILKVKFKDGLKHNYEIFDNKNNLLESAKYTWKDDRNFEAIAERSNGAKTLTSSKLNENYRDLSGSSQYFQNDILIESESYKNNFKSNGEMLSSDYHDEIKNIKYRVLVKFLNKDSIGNSNMVVLENEEKGKLKYLVVREFEYYE